MFRKVSDEHWMRACTDPNCQFTVERFGRSRVGRGWRLDERRVDEHYCFLILDRGGQVRVGEQQLRLRTDSCVWIAPGIEHTLIPDDPQHPFRFFHWRFQLRRSSCNLRCQPDAIMRADAGHLRPLFESAWAEWQAELPLRALRLRNLLAAITGDLLREGPQTTLLDERQRRALLDRIHERFPASVTPAELAATLGLSHDYATRLIRGSFGLPPRQLILRERIRAAAEDLSSSRLPIARIASRWGFEDQRYFARQFRKLMGRSPTAFRNTGS